MTTLVERLGHPPDARLLIVTADDLGSSHAATVGAYEALRTGLVTSAGLMVPCPWAREAAGRYRGEDVGVHLTLTAEYERYRWGPITQAPSLLDGDGGFPRTLRDLWDHADVAEVRREARAQLERAIYWGFDVSHLSVHRDALILRPEFFDVVLELAVDFGLPLRLPDAAAERDTGFPFRSLAGAEGVVGPDRVVRLPASGGRAALEDALASVTPGLTELCLHVAADTPELRALAPDWADRVERHEALTHDASLRALVERARIVPVGYRELRRLLRSDPAGPTRSGDAGAG